MKAIVIHQAPGDPELLPIKAINSLIQADLLIAAVHIREELAEFIAEDCMVAENLPEAAHILTQLPVKSANGSFLLVSVVSGDAVNTEMLLNEVKIFEKMGFRAEIIPGVSQMQAITAACGFPLTRRDRGQSFLVIDIQRMTSPAQLRHHLQAAAASSATLVLMNVLARKESLLALIREERKEGMIVMEYEKADMLIACRVQDRAFVSNGLSKAY